MVTYAEVVKNIKELPMTQLVAVLCVVTGECIRKGCFRPGGASVTVAKIENRIAKEKGKDAPNPEVEPKIVKLTCGKCYSSYTLDTNYIHRTCGLAGCDGKLHKL